MHSLYIESPKRHQLVTSPRYHQLIESFLRTHWVIITNSSSHANIANTQVPPTTAKHHKLIKSPRYHQLIESLLRTHWVVITNSSSHANIANTQVPPTTAKHHKLIKSPRYPNDSQSSYSQFKIGWHSISRLFPKLFQRTRILPMGFTISTKQ